MYLYLLLCDCNDDEQLLSDSIQSVGHIKQSHSFGGSTHNGDIQGLYMIFTDYLLMFPYFYHHVE